MFIQFVLYGSSLSIYKIILFLTMYTFLLLFPFQGDDLSLSFADQNERLVIFSGFFTSAVSGPIYCLSKTEGFQRDSQPPNDFFEDSSAINSGRISKTYVKLKKSMRGCKF